MPGPDAPPGAARPPQLVVAAVLAVLEGVVALVFGVVEIGQIRASRAIVGSGVALFMIGFAVLLVLSARALLRLRRWARAPVVVVQLIMVPVGWGFRGGSTTWVAVAMVAAALVTLVAVLHPRTTRALVGADAPA